MKRLQEHHEDLELQYGQSSKKERRKVQAAYDLRGQGRYFKAMYQDNPIFKRIVSLKQRPGYPPGRPFVVEDGSGRPTECLNKLFSLNPVGGGERQAAKRVVQRFQSGGLTLSRLALSSTAGRTMDTTRRRSTRLHQQKSAVCAVVRSM